MYADDYEYGCGTRALGQHTPYAPTTHARDADRGGHHDTRLYDHVGRRYKGDICDDYLHHIIRIRTRARLHAHDNTNTHTHRQLSDRYTTDAEHQYIITIGTRTRVISRYRIQIRSRGSACVVYINCGLRTLTKDATMLSHTQMHRRYRLVRLARTHIVRMLRTR